MATKARQQYFADEDSLQKIRREFSIADDIQQKIDSVEEGAQVNVIETVKVNGAPLIPDANKAVNVEVPEVIDNLYTIDSDNALSAKQGKVLYDYIQNIASRGRFLSNWNSATGLPMTNPSESPYPYKSGDYFVVSNVAASGGTNYRPDGSSYIIGQASAVVETEDVSVSDFYFYDGTNWLLLSNSGRQIAIDSSLSTTSTNPVENRVITNALNTKQNTLTAGSHINITSDVISTTGLQEELVAGDNITIEDVCTTESDMKGPCPSGYHIPLESERRVLIGTLTTTFGLTADYTTMETYLKMPRAGIRYPDRVAAQGTQGRYNSATCAATGSYDYTRYLEFNSSELHMFDESTTYGRSIRPFKNMPVAPDSDWTTLYDGSSVATGAGIFYNTAEGLISISADGTTWMTMADKNLGATTVYNSGDTLSEANCGKYYQFGNNYGFSRTGNVTTSSSMVDITGYGPGNYYYSDVFSGDFTGWTTPKHPTNLRGGVSQSTHQECIHNVISAVDTTYTAGTGISIDANNVISATVTPGQTYTAGNGINIDSNNEISNTLPGAIVSATAPSSPTEGMVWYDTTNDALKAYNGTSWETEGTKMVVLEYGVSTWQDFIDAYNENAIVYCKVSSGSSGYRMAFMAYTAGQGTPTEVEFQYYRSRSSHSTAANQLDEVYVYKLTNAGVWTTTQRDTGAEMIAGTGIGITFNSSGATINNTGVTSVNGNTGVVTVEEVPSGGTEGQVLTQTNNGPAWQNATGGADIEYVTQAEYNALLPGAESDGKHYFIYSTSGGGWTPGANTLVYWRFNGNLDDSSGNNVTLTGTPYGYDTGIQGQALINKSNRLESSLIGGDVIGGPFAVAFWYGTKNNATLQRIFSFGINQEAVDIQMEFYNDFSGIQVYTNASSTRIAFPFTQPSIGDWDNIIITGDGVNQIECYVNGVKTNPYSNYNTTFTYPSPLTDVEINFYQTSTQECLLDEVVMENKYWTQTDVNSYLANYN